MTPTRSLRVIVPAIVAVLTGVLITVAFFDAREHRDLQRSTIADDARIVTEGFAAQQDRVLHDTLSLLDGLGKTDLVRSSPEEACDAVLRPIRDSLDVYQNFFVADANGLVRCITRTAPEGLSVADRAYFQRARDTGEPVIESYVVGRLDGDPLMIVADPIVADDGAFSGILGTSLDLSWFGNAFRSIPLPEDTSIVMFNASGTVLATEPEPLAQVGASIPDRFLALPIGAEDASEPTTMVGLDGVERMFIAAGLSERVPSVRLAVGVPIASVFAAVQGEFQRDLVLLLVGGLLVALLFGFGLDRVVFRRLDKLMAAAQAMAGGNLDVRTGIQGRDEISVLGRAFDRMAAALHRRAREAEEASLQLAERERRFRLLAHNMSDMVALHDPNGTYRYVSPSFERVLGWSEHDLLGTDPYRLFHPDDIERIRSEGHAAALAGDSTPVIRYRIRRADDSWVWVETTTVPLLHEGEVTALQTSTRDVDARVQAESEREALLERLQRSNRELEEFAYVASHDLQEPLRKIRAFGDRLEGRYEEALDERGRDYLSRMQNAAQRMQTMIEDLLHYSRVETRGQAFERVDLDEVVGEVLGDLEPRIRTTGAEVRMSSLPEIDADRVQMHRLFLNLLANAIKYRRPEVAPVIEVRGSLVDVDGAECGRIEVEDNGIGFEPRHQERIFGMFQRLHGRASYEGTGVGLAVCRRIVERHGGSIRAQAAPNEGATFIVELPLRREDDPFREEPA